MLGVLLLEEVVNSFEDEGILAIIDGTKQWFNESEIRKAAGNASWWRVNTECLFLLDLETILCLVNSIGRLTGSFESNADPILFILLACNSMLLKK